MSSHAKTPDQAGTQEQALAAGIDRAKLPRHVAIIMDGNGRWAQERKWPRMKGHRAGIKTVRRILEASVSLGLEVLTLYTFSVENWKRPREEVKALMRLLKEYIRNESKTLIRKNVRFKPIGRYGELDPAIVEGLEHLVEKTAENTGLRLNAALNYGGRAEIVDACKRLMKAAVEGKVEPDALGEGDLAGHLYTAGLPDPDLLIRTGGEHRISNFLLWQVAYAEIWTTRTFWPDFSEKEYYGAILDFQKRHRRYGGVK